MDPVIVASVAGIVLGMALMWLYYRLFRAVPPRGWPVLYAELEGISFHMPRRNADGSKTVTEADLLFSGLFRLLQDEDWREAIIEGVRADLAAQKALRAIEEMQEVEDAAGD